MKKLNTYLMGMMSVAVCLFSVACSSDDDNETAPKENGKVVTVEAVFANDGMTRAIIEGDGVDAARTMSFEEDDVLRLVGTSGSAKDQKVDFDASKPSGTKIIFTGTLPAGTLADYKAYLISKGSTWEEEGTVPSLTTVGTKCTTLAKAFELNAVISGDYNGSENKYVLSLQNAFVVNTTGAAVTFWYTENETNKSITLAKDEAVAVAAGTVLRNLETSATKTNTVAANHIYKF